MEQFAHLDRGGKRHRAQKSSLEALAIQTLPKVGWPSVGAGRGDGSGNEAKSDNQHESQRPHGSSPAVRQGRTDRMSIQDRASRSALATSGMLVPELLGVECVCRPGNAGENGQSDKNAYNRLHGWSSSWSDVGDTMSSFIVWEDHASSAVI